MKKLVIILLIFVPAFFGTCKKNGTGTGTENPVDTTTTVTPDAGLPRFIVISDTHFGNSRGEGPMVKVPRALKNLTSKTPKADAIFVVGDITDYGNEAQYTQLLSVFGSTANVPDKMPVYYLMGNHDNYNSAYGRSNYMANIKQPLNQYIIIKGYPFITISETGSDQDDYDAAARSFLSEKMAAAAKDYPNKPIFVFIHVPTSNTTYGSWASGALPDGGWSTAVFRATLEKYPQAVVFSGHTHYPLGDPRSIYQDKFTAINTASTTYSEVEGDINLTGGTLPAESNNVTEGLIVNVKENGDVELERWDTYRNEEILPRWTLSAPHDGAHFAYKNRTGGAAPAFANGDKPQVGDITANSCSVTFAQAADDEVVHHYQVEILDGTASVAVARIFSGFYLNSQMPATLTVKLGGLSAKTGYKAKVTAYDSYRQPSSPIVSDYFTTTE
jgi:predicted MPP superfamily phosphohydrolase